MLVTARARKCSTVKLCRICSHTVTFAFWLRSIFMSSFLRLVSTDAYAARVQPRRVRGSRPTKPFGPRGCLKLGARICEHGRDTIRWNKMKPTNPNADTYVEEQKQYSFITFSSEPTCGTPWGDTLRWHSCTTPFLLDTLTWHSCKTLLLATLLRHSYLKLLTWHLARHSHWTLLLDTLVRHSYLTLFWDTLTWHFLLDTLTWHAFEDTLTWHSCMTLLLDTSYLTPL